MKGNNGLGNIIERDEWQTLQWLFDKLNEQYCFTFDCCANEDNKKFAVNGTSIINPINTKTKISKNSENVAENS